MPVAQGSVSPPPTTERAMTMTKKQRRIKYAKAIRRATGMKLPESIKVAKFYMRYLECEFPEPPPSVTTVLENTCGIPGCCYAEVYYVASREGKPITVASAMFGLESGKCA
jgi:hypothetical protein